MKQLVICSMGDLHYLQGLFADITLETTLLTSAGDPDESILSKVVASKVTLNMTYNCEDSASRSEMHQEMMDLERAYFAVTPAVEVSSALQAKVYSLYPRLLQVDCWKMTLESVRIPRGFGFLRHLPEGRPV